MKRFLFVAVLVSSVVVVLGYRAMSATHAQATSSGAGTTATSGAFLNVPIIAAASISATAPRPPRLQPVTDHRRQILDSLDVMATVNSIRQHGTGDEKGWAAWLLASCAYYAKPFDEYVKEMRASQDNFADWVSDEDKRAYRAKFTAEDSDVLSANKSRAYEALRGRCEGVNELTQKERVGLLREFRAEARANPGPIGQFEVIAANSDNGDTRWTPAQADSITAALYGGDPALAKAAFWALYSSIDRNAPGGDDMRSALLFGMAPIYVNPQGSQFENMGLCVVAGLCGESGGFNGATPSYSPAVVRLMDEYRAAFNEHLDARGILSIR